MGIVNGKKAVKTKQPPIWKRPAARATSYEIGSVWETIHGDRFEVAVDAFDGMKVWWWIEPNDPDSSNKVAKGGK